MAPLRSLAWVVYPLLIYFGLAVLEPRTLAIIVGAALVLRQRHAAAALLAGLSAAQWTATALLVALTLATAVTNSELLLRCYPAAVNAAMLAVFGLSLGRPPPFVERIARLARADLPPAAIAYTRRVTWVWCAFFVANGLAAAWTAAFATREAWALYNGLIAYLLMGALFGVELACRRRIMSRPPAAPTP